MPRSWGQGRPILRVRPWDNDGAMGARPQRGRATHGVMPEPGSEAAGRTLRITGARPQRGRATHGIMPEPGSEAAGRTLGITGARPQARLGAVGRSPSIDEWPYYRPVLRGGTVRLGRCSGGAVWLGLRRGSAASSSRCGLLPPVGPACFSQMYEFDLLQKQKINPKRPVKPNTPAPDVRRRGSTAHSAECT